ncbi:hypothetical protein [Sutcliffiella horikoshii]|uniref:hypothetical protein n=1 Tax=Sutcliffiella horikoshii TaxID=79883 RepID=UPI003CE827D7
MGKKVAKTLEKYYLEFIQTLLKDEKLEKRQLLKLYEKEDWVEIKKSISKVEKINNLKEDINKFLETKYNQYKKEIYSDNKKLYIDEVHIEEFVDAQSNIRKVRIKTDKGNNAYYSNIMSIKLFNMIIMEIAYILQNCEYLRTKDIVTKLKKSIEEESEYKNYSTCRVPVYSCCKYLLSLGILSVDPNNKHKYLLNEERNIGELKALVLSD